MFIEKGIEKALAFPQEQLRSEEFKNNDNILPFTSTYVMHCAIWYQTL